MFICPALSSILLQLPSLQPADQTEGDPVSKGLSSLTANVQAHKLCPINQVSRDKQCQLRTLQSRHLFGYGEGKTGRTYPETDRWEYPGNLNVDVSMTAYPECLELHCFSAASCTIAHCLIFRGITPFFIFCIVQIKNLNTPSCKNSSVQVPFQTGIL